MGGVGGFLSFCVITGNKIKYGQSDMLTLLIAVLIMEGENAVSVYYFWNKDEMHYCR